VSRAVKEMTNALDAFDESSAEQALQQLMGEYSTLAVIREVIMPYLYEVGERWAGNHMTVAQEHLASSFVHRGCWRSREIGTEDSARRARRRTCNGSRPEHR
jgi:methanogenic corrinoid protein MtbC1